MIRVAVLAFLFVFSLPAQSQLYKWVDKDGKVQYSDQPPPENVKQQQKLDIRSAPASPEAAPAEAKPASPRTTAEKELEFRKRRAEEDEAKAKELAQAKQNQEKCEEARQRLRTYAEGRVFKYDENGERVYLEDSAVERALAQAKKDMASWCK